MDPVMKIIGAYPEDDDSTALIVRNKRLSVLKEEAPRLMRDARATRKPGSGISHLNLMSLIYRSWLFQLLEYIAVTIGLLVSLLRSRYQHFQHPSTTHPPPPLNRKTTTQALQPLILFLAALDAAHAFSNTAKPDIPTDQITVHGAAELSTHIDILPQQHPIPIPLSQTPYRVYDKFDQTVEILTGAVSLLRDPAICTAAVSLLIECITAIKYSGHAYEISVLLGLSLIGVLSAAAGRAGWNTVEWEMALDPANQFDDETPEELVQFGILDLVAPAGTVHDMYVTRYRRNGIVVRGSVEGRAASMVPGGGRSYRI
ncbi:hypothetical protein BO70DRAFT_426309 [Aspergillus heteromorphus CBS 117.55]|uniref:Uncharacterized protein n=1 Tax=Aspergillus heteromorphus CBS 117.55 TaxID=1448321 RepID=A0A317WXE9_9EURO|nr:uncharacterized protein BO70DRAFT_426309 [Aspergillus heteromorphus CBS 117.55]PWY89887.1 hypothetical protein BO70DRAFT_426309 [Aspergillus heteromorphus CBS 117.55]